MRDVTVVIPFRNRLQFVAGAVSSVAKSERVDRIIVVDDASDDDAGIHLSRVLPGYVAIIRNKHRLGAAASRNRGLQLVRSKYVAFLDDDDEWIPGALDQCAAILDRDDEGTLSGVIGSYVVFPAVGVSNGGDGVRLIWQRDLVRYNVAGPTSCALLRTDAVRAVGGFDPQLPSCQDWDLWVRLTVEGPLLRLDRPVVKYRIHADRISEKLDAVVEGRKRFMRKLETAQLLSRRDHQVHLRQIALLLAEGGKKGDAMAVQWLALKLRPWSGTDMGHLVATAISARLMAVLVRWERLIASEFMRLRSRVRKRMAEDKLAHSVTVGATLRAAERAEDQTRTTLVDR